MDKRQVDNYHRVAEAIDYIRQNFRQRPSLDEIAEKLHLSPFHFQRIFTEWAGVSPKRFLQYTSLQYARQLLKEKQSTLFDAAHETGLSGTGRLHDMFVKIEGMTPGEYKSGGKNLNINYSFASSPFGEILAASTDKGICYMAFIEDREQGLNILKKQFPRASFRENADSLQQNALGIFSRDWIGMGEIKLHLRGGDFQLKVWEALLKIPMGNLVSYKNIADQLGNPNASRAVGTAIGSNPVAFLIPCHRVIQTGGKLGGYMWGLTRKTAMIGWEAGRRMKE